jgi:hypothetical protein
MSVRIANMVAGYFEGKPRRAPLSLMAATLDVTAGKSMGGG